MGVMNIILCVILVCHMGRHRCNAVQIDINPSKTIATIGNDIHISCLPDGDEDNGKQLTLIELSRNDQDTIVFVSQCGNISYGHDSSSKFQAIGHIDKVPSQSYLNVTLVNPESQDTGIYTCIMVHLNTEGHLETETNSRNLLVENLDVNALEGVLNKMKDRITSLEKENKDLHKKDSQLVEQNGKLKKEFAEKIAVLEQVNKNQSLEFDAFKEKVTYTNFFVATNKKMLKTSAGKVLVWPDMISSAGTGYDEKTGVFTSPVAGLYVFHVFITTNKACHFNINLMVNEKIASILYTFDKNAWEQSSISLVTELQAGDRVFCKTTSSCTVHYNFHSVFSGHLIKTH